MSKFVKTQMAVQTTDYPPKSYRNIAYAWLQACRLPSQLYLALSLLLGQTYYLYENGSIDLGILAGLFLFSLCHQLYIVFANDLADVETDKLNQTATLFSGGSRTLVAGLLTESAMKKAAFLMAALSLLTSFFLSFIIQSWRPALCGIGALGLLWGYSFSPLKLSYRGGGELLQVLGLAILLPAMGYWTQGGQKFPWHLLTILGPTHLACAVATSLSDQISDAQSGKKTLTVFLGQTKASWLIMILNTASLYFFAASIGQKQPPYIALGLAGGPILSQLLYLLCYRAMPGQLKMSFKILFAVLVTQWLMAMLCLHFYVL